MTVHGKFSKLLSLTADDIMTEDVTVIKESMTIAQVVHLMLRERVSGYPVISDDKKLVGIVTMTDFFILIDQMVHESDKETKEGAESALHEKFTDFKDEPVSKIMSNSLITIKPDTPIIDIIDLVARTKMHTFPVMKDEKLVGIIGRRDVLNAAFAYA